MPYVKGQSGNPAGRPPGARNKATLALEERLEARAGEIVDVAVRRALLGDTVSLRMCLDRILPRGRDRPVPFVLPPLVGTDAAERAVEGIRVAIGTGELTKKLTVRVHAISASAREKVEAAGGTVELLREPKVKKVRHHKAKPVTAAAAEPETEESTDEATPADATASAAEEEEPEAADSEPQEEN